MICPLGWPGNPNASTFSARVMKCPSNNIGSNRRIFDGNRFWSKSGAENILALRCLHSSRRLEDFWKYRLNQHAARNDALPLAA